MFQTIIALVIFLIIPITAQAAGGGTIYNLHGKVWINGQEADRHTPIHFGDKILTGTKSRITIELDGSVYRMTGRSRLTLPEGSKNIALHLLYGKLLAVFRHNSHKTIYTSTAVLGVRGTGIYLNSEHDQTYLCTCYGDIDLTDRDNEKYQAHVHATHHNAIVFDHDSRQVKGNQPMLEHVDADLFELEALASRTPPKRFETIDKSGNSLVVNSKK